MRVLTKRYDGGENSGVTGYWLIEIKYLFSIVLLKFEPNNRENFHTHAFNALTWFLKGDLWEERIWVGEGVDSEFIKYKRSILPKITRRNNLHKTHARSTSWCLSIRGPWTRTWQEYNQNQNMWFTLTHGRKIHSVDAERRSILF